jgi:hypothetical protein
LGTDGNFYSEVELAKTSEEAFECGCSLIADMAETMSLDNVNPEEDWRLEGEEWYFQVRVEERDF